MKTRAARTRSHEANDPNGATNGRLHLASDEEWRALIDRAARYYLKMTGADFLVAWERGDFRGAEDRADVMPVAMLLPLGCR